MTTNVTVYDDGLIHITLDDDVEGALQELVLTPEDALKLWQAIPGKLGKVPAMIGGAGAVTCPHCRATTMVGTDDTAVVEVDWAWRENNGLIGVEDARHVSFTQGQDDFETVAFKCAACGRLVSLPANEYALTWS